MISSVTGTTIFMRAAHLLELLVLPGPLEEVPGGSVSSPFASALADDLLGLV